MLLEIAGLPGAGKTTLAHGLKQRLTDIGLSVINLDENAETCPFPSTGREWEFNVWAACSAVRDTLRHQNLGGLCIQDRGLFDARCLLDWSAKRCRIPVQTARRADAFVAERTWYDGASLTVHVTIEPSEAVRRHGGPGTVINQLTLSEMARSYERLSDAAHRTRRLVRLDSTHTSPERLVDDAIVALAQLPEYQEMCEMD